MPFAYGALYVISMVVYFYGNESASQLCDTLFYVSPVIVLCFLSLSHTLRLCKWHRRACCVPLIPQVITLLDYYVIELSDIAVVVNLSICVSSIVILFLSAYKIFLS